MMFNHHWNIIDLSLIAIVSALQLSNRKLERLGGPLGTKVIVSVDKLCQM